MFDDRSRSLTARPLPGLLAALMLALLVTLPGPAHGTPVLTREEAEPVRLIVRFAPHAELNVTAQSVAHLRAGGQRSRTLRNMPGYDLVTVAKGSPAEAAIRRYRTDPAVLYVEPDHPRSIAVGPDDPLFGNQWALENTGQNGGTPGADINATVAWDAVTGSRGVLVAVIDTGVDYEHPDLAPNMWGGLGWDFAYDTDDPMDVHGHGTHVAGTIAAAADNGFGVAGVAWESSIMALKALGNDGNGWTSDIIESVTYANLNGADIINMSLGGGGYSQAFYDAIAASDALVVCAAGNNGTNNDSSPFYPASYALDNIVSVAATDRTDTLASFSNHGATSVDLAAPGVAILSTMPGHTYEAATVFSDTFDTLAAWNPAASYTYHPWASSSTRYASPSHSAGYAPPDGYPANEQSWLVTNDLFALSGAERVTLRFKARLDTVSVDDWLMVAARPQGGHWTLLTYVAGATGGTFRDYEVDASALAGTNTQFAFIFDSWYAAGPGSGVWVDDVAVDSLTRDGGADHSEAFAYMNGTSMAAPHVAGAAALLKALSPGITTAELKSAIMDSAEPRPSLSGKMVTGGRLDAAAALTAIDPPATTLGVAPEQPDGDSGWYVSAPGITLTPDREATTYYAWGADPFTTTAAQPGIVAPEGLTPLTYYSVDTAGNEEEHRIASFSVDLTPPDTPIPVVTSTGIGTATLDWEPVTDTVSGLAHYEVRQGGSVVATTTAGTYDIDGLSPDTAHSFTVAARDVAGNTSESVPVDVSTFALTEVADGSDGAVTVVFPSAWTTGGVSATKVSPSHPLPDGFVLVAGDCYDITTSVDFSGDALVTIAFDPAGLSPAEETAIRLFHYSGGAWADITTGLDTVDKTVTGATPSFSEFAVVTESDPDVPVVLTPASSTWSLLLLGAVGFTLLICFSPRRRTGSLDG